MADRYWINTTSGNWNDNANWSTTPTGAGGASYPTASDDAYFTSSRNGDCTINLSTIACNNLVFTDNDPAISTAGYTGTLNALTQYSVHGNYCWFSSTMTKTGAGSIIFKGNGDVSLNCGVPFIGGIYVQLASMTDRLIPRDDMVYEFGSGSFIQIQSGWIDFTIFSTKCTFSNTGNSQIVRILTSAEYAIKFYDLEKTGGGALRIQREEPSGVFPDDKCKILVKNNLILKGTSESNRIIFNAGPSTGPGNPYPVVYSFTGAIIQCYIEVQGMVDVDYIIIRGIKNTAATDWNLTSVDSGDGGFNNGIDFTASRTSYYVGGASAGNLGDDKWKSTSGGATGVRIPLPQDDCRIDANSFTGAQTLTHNLPVLPKINFTGSSSVTFAVGSNIVYCVSDLNFTNLSAFSGIRELWFEKTGNMSFIGSFSNIVRVNNPNTVVKLTSNFVSSNFLVVDNGEFDANGYNVTVRGLNSFVSSPRTIKMGSGTWTIEGVVAGSSPYNNQTFNIFNPTNLTFNAGTSLLKLTGAPSSTVYLWMGGNTGLSFYNFENAQSGGAGKFVLRGDNCSFNNIKINAGLTQEFWRGYTFTVNSFTAEGTSGSPITIKSGYTTAFNIVKSGGGVIDTVDYCDISYSAASPANTWYAGENSTDSGNNTGWLFEDAPSGEDYFKTVTDVVKLVDVVSSKFSGTWKKSVSDSVVLFDSDVKKNSKVVSDELSLVDDFNSSWSTSKLLSDSIVLEESVSAKITGKSLKDVVSLDDVLEKQYVGVRGLSDKITLFDSDFKNNSKFLDDVVNVNDSVFKKTSKIIVAHCPTLNDSMSLIPGKNLVSDFSLSDDLSKHFEGNRVLLDELVLNDIILKDNELNFSDNIGLNSVLNNKTVKILSDGFSVNDSYERNMFKNIVDEVLLFDSDKKFYSKGLFDNISFKEFVEGGTFISLTDSVKLDDVKSNLVSKNRLSDKLSLVDLVDKKMVTELNDSFNLFDDVVKKPGKVLLDNFLLTDYHVFSIVKYIKDVIGLNEFVNKSIFKFPFSDEFVLADSVFKKPVKDLLDELVLDDSVSRFVSRIYDDNITLYDSDSKHTLKVLKDFIDYRDKVLKKPGKVLLNELSLFDLNVIKNVLLVKKDELFLDEVLSKFVSKKPFIDEIILDDVVNKTSMKPLNDSFNITDLNVLPDLKQTITEMQQDFISILQDIPAAEYIDWVRRGKIEDEFGRYKTGKDEFVKKIYIILQPLTEKDRNILPQGVNVNSYMKAYAEPRYYYGNKRIDIKAGDIFIRSDGQKYMVEQVAGKWGNFKAQVFRKLLLKGIDNDA